MGKKTCQTCEKRWRRKKGKTHCEAYTKEPADKSLCWTDDPEWECKLKESSKKYWLNYYGRVAKPK